MAIADGRRCAVSPRRNVLPRRPTQFARVRHEYFTYSRARLHMLLVHLRLYTELQPYQLMGLTERGSPTLGPWCFNEPHCCDVGLAVRSTEPVNTIFHHYSYCSDACFIQRITAARVLVRPLVGRRFVHLVRAGNPGTQ